MEENKRKVMSSHDVKQPQCSGPQPHVHPQGRNTTNFKVCRVCLAMNVRMYHISEHKLRVAYEQVTGLKITSNDKLPQILCWECVARLLLANRFIKNASKTQEILLNMTSNDRYVTINDIKSIDRTKNQLESTLHTKYNINQFNLHIDKDNHVSKEYDNELVRESNKNCDEDSREVKFYEQNPEINVHLYNEQIDSIEVGISDERAPIKSEQEEINEILEVTDNSYITYVNEVDMKVEECEIKSEAAYSSNEDVTNIKDEDTSDEVAAERQNKTMQESNQMDKSSEMCAVIKQRWKKKYNSPTPLRNQRSKALPRCKNLISTSPYKGLIKCITQDSSKLFVNAHSMKDAENEFHLPIEERITFEDKNKTFVKLTNKASKYKSTGTEKVNPGNTVHTNASTSNEGNGYLMVNENESCSKLFLCDICDKPFHNKSSLTRHIRKHPKLYKCTYCSYKAYHKVDLNEHTSVKHKKLSCDQSSTSKHNNNNKDKKNIFYNCSYCSYKAYRKNDLSNHINTEHVKSKQISNTVFNCSYCSYKTYQKYDLCKHIDVNHSKIATFNCSFCIYTAYRKNQLDQHINARHTKSTVFNCSYCSFKAYNKSYLNKHVKDKHS